MPMRLSGLMSGMDTESIVAQLVEAKKTKVTKAVKAQKSLKYKQDAWKTLNTQIMNLYNKHLSNMRFESAYKKKTTKVSNSSIVSVITGENAMNSVQSLTVDKLAKSGFLTGSKLQELVDEKGNKVDPTGSTTLGELGLAAGDDGSIEITVGEGANAKTQVVNVNSGTTINSFINSLREAGVNANFDANNGRIYIASKASGSKSDFQLTAKNITGLDALQTLGLNYARTRKNEDGTEELYYDQPTFSDADKEAVIQARKDSLLKSLTAQRGSLMDEQTKLAGTRQELVDKAVQLKGSWSQIIDLYDKDGNLIKWDEVKDGMSDATLAAIGEAIAKGEPKTEGTMLPDDLKQWLGEYNSYTKAVDENKAALAKVDSQLTIDGDGNVTGLNEDASEVKNIATRVNKVLTEPSDEDLKNMAKKTDGTDAIIHLNGEEYTHSNNTFDINGLTLTVNATTAKGEEVTITTQDDTDGIYDMIKGFLKDYNALINQMDKLYNADSAKGYEPLTDEEKEAMSDSQIEEWETKIKDSILRKDSSLNSISSLMKRVMMEGVEVNGKKMYLSNFGIGTLSYFTAAENEKNAYHIDGDSDDEHTSGNPDKLKSMIANDPDTVVAFFSKLSENLRGEMFEAMKDTDYSSSFSAYEDKKMKTDYDDYTTKIKELEKKLADYEDKWYAKFAAMETALAKMQNNASAVTSLLGG